MNKLYLIMPLSLLFSVSAWSQTEHPLRITTNSLSEAALQIHKRYAPKPTNTVVNVPYTNESEKNNSLARGALAKQGVKMHLYINADSQAHYYRHQDPRQENNSLFRGVMARENRDLDLD